jgi:hypothetical protein
VLAIVELWMEGFRLKVLGSLNRREKTYLKYYHENKNNFVNTNFETSYKKGKQETNY